MNKEVELTQTILKEWVIIYFSNSDKFCPIFRIFLLSKAKGHLHLSKYGEDICYCPPMYWRPEETAKMVAPWFQLLCIGAKLASFEVEKKTQFE